jgi:hypothetical protein
LTASQVYYKGLLRVESGRYRSRVVTVLFVHRSIAGMNISAPSDDFLGMACWRSLGDVFIHPLQMQ